MYKPSRSHPYRLPRLVIHAALGHPVAFCCPPGHEPRDDRFSLFQAYSSHKPPERGHRTIHNRGVSLATEYRTLWLLTDVRLLPRDSHGSRRRAKLDLSRRVVALLLDGRGDLLHALDELRASGTFGRSRPRLRVHDAAAQGDLERIAAD